MADRPMRIQRRRTKGWKMPEGAVYVGRPSRWGNDFKAGDIHPYALPENLTTPEDVEQMRIDAQGAVDLYALCYATAGLLMNGDDDPFEELRGRHLACWCRLCKRHAAGKPFDEPCPDCPPCHADFLGTRANDLSCDSPPASGEPNG